MDYSNVIELAQIPDNLCVCGHIRRSHARGPDPRKYWTFLKNCYHCDCRKFVKAQGEESHG